MVEIDAEKQPAGEQTWSRGKLQEISKCPACGSGERLARIYRRQDDSVSMPDIWEMATCASCGSIYLDPRPDDESLPRVYDTYLTHARAEEVQADKGFLGFVWRLINGYLNSRFGLDRSPSLRLGAVVFGLALPWRRKLDHYCRHLYSTDYPGRGSLLDLGCGDGSFLERAREMGWNAVGCEPDATAVEVCRSAGLEVIHGDIFSEQLDGRQFDVVTARHVIEHVPDIERVLSRIYSIIKPGGTVWFAFPNTNCLSLKVFGAAAVALHIPYHICIPSREQFSKLLGDAGFDEVVLVRQGVQSRSNWVSSDRIAAMQDLPRPGRLGVYLGGVLSDLMSTISARWGEELVFLARKDRLS